MSSTPVVDLRALALGALPLLAALGWLSRSARGLSWTLFLSWLRGAVQLLLLGLLLQAWVGGRSGGGALLLLGIMWLWGASRAYRAAGVHQPLAWAVAAAAVVLPSLALLFVLLWAVPALRAAPLLWVVFGGLLGANAMNGYHLFTGAFAAALAAARAEVETKLCLGAALPASIAGPRRTALRTAAAPLWRVLATAGAVQVPGVLCGAIAAGLPPFEAACLALLTLELAVGASLGAALLAAVLTYRLFFTAALQFRAAP